MKCFLVYKFHRAQIILYKKMELQRSLERWAYESKNASVTSITGTPHELTANLVKIQTYPIIIISYTVLHEGLSWPERMKVMSANKSIFTSRHKHSEGAEEKVGNKESITTCFRDNNVNVRKITLVVKCREKREELIIFTESPLLFHHFLKLTWKVFSFFFHSDVFFSQYFPHEKSSPGVLASQGRKGRQKIQWANWTTLQVNADNNLLWLSVNNSHPSAQVLAAHILAAGGSPTTS